MDLKLLFRCSYSLFSLRRNNMRFLNFKRLFISILLIPLFSVLLLINQVFLLIDFLLFPNFKNQKIKNPVFIISAPRSATTYLFHQLSIHPQTTSFKLWEIILAPSVTQKYIILSIIKLDNKIGRPIISVIEMLENFILKKFNSIHLLSLKYPEEDEAILLWNFSTIYLHFFYPDNNFFDDYIEFDDQMSENKKNTIMKFYYRCIQRHNYVFNRDNQKIFVSKNPAMMSKVKTLYTYFPDSKIININRCPSKTIPSTIALNEAIFSFFSSHRLNDEIKIKLEKMMLKWYQMANKYLSQYYKSQFISIDFRELTNDKKIFESIFNFCNIKNIELQPVKDIKHKSKNEYIEISKTEMENIYQELPFMKKYCS